MRSTRVMADVLVKSEQGDFCLGERAFVCRYARPAEGLGEAVKCRVLTVPKFAQETRVTGESF